MIAIKALTFILCKMCAKKWGKVPIVIAFLLLLEYLKAEKNDFTNRVRFENLSNFVFVKFFVMNISWTYF